MWADLCQSVQLTSSGTLASSQQGREPAKTIYGPNSKYPKHNERYGGVFFKIPEHNWHIISNYILIKYEAATI